MKKSKSSEEPIIGILREAESDTPVEAVCARANIAASIVRNIEPMAEL